MASGVVFYHDWRDPATPEWRFRLEMIEPFDGELWDVVTAPAWDAGEAAGTGYKLIPSDALPDIKVPGGEAAYDGPPIGIPSTPTASLTFKLDVLGFEGPEQDTAAMADLGKMLMNPVDIDYAVNVNDLSFTIKGRPVIRLLSDHGNAGLGVETFYVDFTGVIAQKPERELELGYVSGDEITVTARHLGAYLLEQIPTSVVAQYALRYLNSTTYVSGPTSDYAVTHLYYSLFVATGTTYATCTGNPGTTDERKEARTFREATLMTALQACAQAAYVELIRYNSLSASAFLIRSSITRAYDSTATPLFINAAGSALTHWGFFKRGYNLANGSGGIITHTPDYAMHFIGAYWANTAADYAIDGEALYDADIAGELQGGLFVEADPNSIYKFNNAYDLVADYCRGCLAKGAWQQARRNVNEGWGLSLFFGAPFYSIGDLTEFSDDQTLVRGEALSDGENSKAKISLPALRFRTATVSQPEPQGDDPSTVAADALFGNASESDYGIQAFWSTSPTSGSKDEWDRMHEEKSNGVALHSNGDLDGGDFPYIAAQHPYYPCRTLFYYEEPIVAGDNLGDPGVILPILPYGKCIVEIGDGLGTIPTATVYGETAHYINILDNTNVEAAWREWIELQRNVEIFHQRRSGMAYAASKRIVDAFSSERQFSVPLTVEWNKGGLWRLGQRIEFRDDSNNLASLNIFNYHERSVDYLTTALGFPSVGIIVSTQPTADGFSSIALFAPVT